MAKEVLVEDEQLVTVTVYYRYKVNAHGVKQFKILEEEEGKELLAAGTAGVDSLTTWWTVPSWKPNNDMLRQSTFYSPSEGVNKMDWSKYQENTFKNCLKKWDVQDKEGKIIPITAENIGKLPTLLGNAVLDKYDKCLVLEDDERKKS